MFYLNLLIARHPHNPNSMDLLTILIIMAVLLLFYQVVLNKDPDQLDNTGHPVRGRKRG